MSARYRLLFGLLGATALLLAASACSIGETVVSSPAIEARVLEEGPNKPIAGAIVIVRWAGIVGTIGHSSSVCYHVENAVSDSQGLSRTPAWKKLSPYGDMTYRRKSITAYRPGYVYSREQDGVVYLNPFTGTRGERLDYLSRVAISCSDKREIEINLLPLYKALYEEARTLAVTKEEKLKAFYRLRDVERLELGSDQAWENFRQRQRDLQ